MSPVSKTPVVEVTVWVTPSSLTTVTSAPGGTRSVPGPKAKFWIVMVAPDPAGFELVAAGRPDDPDVEQAARVTPRATNVAERSIRARPGRAAGLQRWAGDIDAVSGARGLPDGGN